MCCHKAKMQVLWSAVSIMMMTANEWGKRGVGMQAETKRWSTHCYDPQLPGGGMSPHFLCRSHCSLVLLSFTLVIMSPGMSSVRWEAWALNGAFNENFASTMHPPSPGSLIPQQPMISLHPAKDDDRILASAGNRLRMQHHLIPSRMLPAKPKVVEPQTALTKRVLLALPAKHCTSKPSCRSNTRFAIKCSVSAWCATPPLPK